MASGESSISVAVRIRPFSAKEASQLAPTDLPTPFLGDGGLSCSPNKPIVPTTGPRTRFLRPIITPVDDKVLIFDPPDANPLSRLYANGYGIGQKKAKDVRYAFDKVLDQSMGQEAVFDATTKPLLDGILNGYNATVFAYGATGCGKTHTISGSPEDPGVILLTMKELYARIGDAEAESEVSIRLSYLEIYNETIRDLLSAEPTPSAGGGLLLREDSANKISVVGITELVPASPQNVLEAITEGNKRRTMSPTEANAVSSRSHAVLQINVTQRPRASGTSAETTSASLSIIDLAGSERASATSNNGARMKEGANINKSLLALGNCINALCSTGGARRAHVPYRNSKLTRLLKFSLGGNCKTVMIVCVSPSSAHYDETHNTLKYANQAKNIRTKVSRNMLNVDRHVAQYVQAIHELKEEVAELKGRLAERGALETAGEKRKRDEIAREVAESNKRMRESTDNVKRLVTERAHCAAQLEAASLRLDALRSAAVTLDAEIAAAPSDEALAERAILGALIARTEARATEEATAASARALDNSLQMQHALIVAASHNVKFDDEASARIKMSGDALLREVDAARALRLYEGLKDEVRAGSADVALAASAAARATTALKAAAGELEYRSTRTSAADDVAEGESVAEALGRLAKALRAAGAANDQVFARLAGAPTPDVPAPVSGKGPVARRAFTVRRSRSSLVLAAPASSSRLHPSLAARAPAPLRRASMQQAPQRPPASPLKVRPGHVSSSLAAPTAASLAKSHHLTSPRKSGRRISVGGRRMSTLRPAPRTAPADKPPKKTFRWADEAGEGSIDDTNPRSAVATAPGQPLPSEELGSDEEFRTLAVAAAAKSRATAASPTGSEEHVSSGAEWEDLEGKRGGASSKRSVSGGGALFDRNFLAKRAAANASLGALSEADDASASSSAPLARTRALSTTSAAAARTAASRAPFAELAQTRSASSASLAPPPADFAPRSSPYKRGEGSVGPVRRRGRSSLNAASFVCAPGTADKMSSSSPRVASGPVGSTRAADSSAELSRSAKGGMTGSRSALNTRATAAHAPAVRVNVPPMQQGLKTAGRS